MRERLGSAHNRRDHHLLPRRGKGQRSGCRRRSSAIIAIFPNDLDSTSVSLVPEESDVELTLPSVSLRMNLYSNAVLAGMVTDTVQVG